MPRYKVEGRLLKEFDDLDGALDELVRQGVRCATGLSDNGQMVIVQGTRDIGNLLNLTGFVATCHQISVPLEAAYARLQVSWAIHHGAWLADSRVAELEKQLAKAKGIASILYHALDDASNVVDADEDEEYAYQAELEAGAGLLGITRTSTQKHVDVLDVVTGEASDSEGDDVASVYQNKVGDVHPLEDHQSMMRPRN